MKTSRVEEDLQEAWSGELTCIYGALISLLTLYYVSVSPDMARVMKARLKWGRGAGRKLYSPDSLRE